MTMYQPPFYGYPYFPQTGEGISIRDVRKAQKRAIKDFRAMEEFLKKEGDSKKKEEKKDDKPKAKTFTVFEVFMLLTLFSPIIGPLWTYLLVAGAKGTLANLSTLIK